MICPRGSGRFAGAEIRGASLTLGLRLVLSGGSVEAYGLPRFGDACAPSLALGVAIVRIGCFAASCDYGKATDLPWAVVFTRPDAARLTGIPLGVPVHPSQLYESALGVALFACLLMLERRPRRQGCLIFAFAGLFAKVLLALVARRENQPELARKLLKELSTEFPSNPLFRRELALLRQE